MRDLMMTFNAFAHKVADALNKEKVIPLGKDLCALMVIVGRPPDAPYAGSLNYVEDKGWVVNPELSQGTPVSENEPPTMVRKGTLPRK